MMTSSVDPRAHFASSYTDARKHFRAAVSRLGLSGDSITLPGWQGASGEALTMDWARLGPPDAERLLILTSGTHGIEGYCGSGCQVALLHDPSFLDAARASELAVLLIHAVNPYGFSHSRRVNEDNVDLNRNFRDFREPLPECAAYAALHPLLLPASWPPPADNTAQLGAYVAAQGQAAFQAALSGGQYAFPRGLFYGGHEACWSNRALRAILREQAGACARLCWIDIHSGLGPRGHGELIHAGRDDPSDLARARTCWGDGVTSFHDGSSTSARVSGIVTGAAFDECPGTEITAIGLEYGTLPLAEVFTALRGDHWLHEHPEAPPALREAIRTAMRRAFYDEADDWIIAVVEQAQERSLQALAYLHKSDNRQGAE